MGNVLDVMNNVFLGIFIVEIIIKLVSEGIKIYWLSGWNVFDFTLITLSIVVTILDYLSIKNTFGKYILIFRFNFIDHINI